MKSRTPALSSALLPPPAPRRTESGVRRATGPASAPEYLDDFGEETTAVETVSVHLVAATAARGDALDDLSPYDDEPATSATPVDLAAMLSILATNGIPSPLGDVPLPPPMFTLPLGTPSPLGRTLPMGTSSPILALHAPHIPQRAEIYASPTIHFTRAPSSEVPPPRAEPRLLVVALVTFLTTLVVAVGLAWAVAGVLLRR